MNKKIFMASFVAIVVLIAILAYEVTSFYLAKDDMLVSEDVYDMNEDKPSTLTSEANQEVEQDDPENKGDTIKTDSSNVSKITPSTRVVYQTYYTIDDKLETYESEPPYYLIDMTREEIETYYTDWQLMAFSEDKVVLRKTLEDRNPSGYYIVKEYDGLIAVYYDYTEDLSFAFENAVAIGEYEEDGLDEYREVFLDEYKDNYLREIIETPVHLLSEEEQANLQEGILIYEDDLISFIENYTS